VIRLLESFVAGWGPIPVIIRLIDHDMTEAPDKPVIPVHFGIHEQILRDLRTKLSAQPAAHRSQPHCTIPIAGDQRNQGSR
jgi:hypothetical protein